MFVNKPLLACVTLAAASLPQYAQTSAPPAPAAPSAPRAMRGRSVTTRSVSRQAWLGVGLVEVTPDRVRALKMKDDSGVEVTHVEENSPAAKAGLKEHDVILEVNGQKVDEGDQFARTIAEMTPGSKASLTIWRNGAKQTVTATLESRPNRLMVFNGPSGDWMAPMPPLPAMPPDWNTPNFMTGQAPRVGFEGETLTPQLAEFFGVKEGVLVRTVSEKTAASKAGLKAGDVIIKVSGTPVSSTREISGIIRALHRNVTFTVMRNHREMTLNVELAEDRTPGPDREAL